jgi:hypothetical protein
MTAHCATHPIRQRGVIGSQGPCGANAGRRSAHRSAATVREDRDMLTLAPCAGIEAVAPY